VECSAGSIGRDRIVGHHHNRFAMITIQRLQQSKDFFTGFTIQITGRLVAKQQRWIGDYRAGDTDALLLPAGTDNVWPDLRVRRL
jgi:hypothetical protein